MNNNVNTSSTQQPILIDRELFFGNPLIVGGQLSPDGKWLTFLKEHQGIMNIWLKPLDAPFAQAIPLTASEQPLYGYFWTYDSQYVLYAKDNDGDENTNIYALDPFTATKDQLPEARNLTPFKEVAAQIENVNRNQPDIMFVALNDRDKAWHDLYKLEISTGKLTEIYRNTDRCTSYEFDWDDNLRLLTRTDEKGNTEYLRIDTDNKLQPIYHTTVTENAYIAGWTPNNRQIYLVSDKETDLSTLYLMDLDTLTISKVESDPENRVDFGGAIFDRNSRELVATSYIADKKKYYWKNKQWQDIYEFAEQQFPGREVELSSSTLNYDKFLVSIGGDKYAAESYLLDVKSKKISHQYTARPDLKKIENALAPMQPISYPSSDGLTIPAYLTIPVGQTGKNLPTVILVHGGPKGPRDYWGYDPTVQFLANRGYAVLQPNYRASGGYGRNFLNAGDLQWGKLMQDDITWGAKYLIEQGFADKNKIVIMGGSYGGYATLAGLAFTPDLYAAGVDIVGPSNLFTLLDSIPPYWESARAFLYGMTGDPATEEGKQRIREASPLFHIEKINRPLLIVQGANDPRVKQAEADQIVVALRDKGKQVSYLLADDEGHGFAKPINLMAMFAEIEKFLASILGGRFQHDMPAEVAKRLQELTMDIKAVQHNKKPS